MSKKARIKRERKAGTRKNKKSERQLVRTRRRNSRVLAIKADEPSVIVRPTLNDVIASNMAKR